MGLAAGQARLLTITGRKSDCEFESMRLSHQKIALARELADLSNQYQDSLDYTKLVYDYYGTGDTNTPLSYGIMMSPSILNDFIPITLTDSMGRVVLDSKRAAAARTAGIPQEGLGTLPSETVRNAFIVAMGEQGVISNYLVDKIVELPYNQAAGLGGGATVAFTTEEVTLDKIMEMLSEYSVDLNSCIDNTAFDKYGSALSLYAISSKGNKEEIANRSSNNTVDCDGRKGINSSNISLADFLNNSFSLALAGNNRDNKELRGEDGRWDSSWRIMIANMDLWDTLYEVTTDIFGLDDYSQHALEYAQYELDKLIRNIEPDTSGRNNQSDMARIVNEVSNDGQGEGYTRNWALSSASQYIGCNQYFNGGDDYNDGISVNLSYLVKAYFTWFADFMNGVSTTDIYGKDLYYVGDTKVNSKFVTDDPSFKYHVKTGKDISSDDMAQATFYDAMFNQLCLNGWTENDNVNDNDYVQKMLENGMMYITKMKEDGYYYQGNYATDNYIKVVADERKIAAAEAKYNTEKAKLNAKEQTLDMKMKNLDTEISSLTTEYDTIKNTLSKNIERGFKRYSA